MATPDTAFNSSAGPSLLIIGATKAGKTHYGGQLLRRLQKKRGKLRMVRTPSDLTVFEEVCESLANGRSAPHTPTGFYRESVWDVRSADDTLGAKLVWPDYGGEDVENITLLRHLTEPWVHRIRESNGWLLFVRLNLLKPPEDILGRPRSLEQMNAARGTTPSAPIKLIKGGEEKSTKEEPSAVVSGASTSGSSEQPLSGSTLSDQARLVELLQALLFVRQVGVNARLRQPTLLIALSCLDELPDAKRAGTWTLPGTLLQKRLPLLNAFITSNWQRDFVEVIGLSALGRALRDDVSDEEFIDNGPERQGWCVLPDGEESSDLTLPVMILMEKAKRGMSTRA